MDEFKEKLVVVTGGSRGIGRACCLYFAKKGANILFTYNKSQVKAQQLEDEIKELGSKCKKFQLDVCDYDQCTKLSEEAIDQFGKVDVLINNAGIIKDKALMRMPKEDWSEVLETNLTGVFNVTKNFIITFMKQSEGNIINITSLSGIIGLPRQTNYAASKGGVISFTRSLAREVAPFNIRVNAIAPGFIHTDMLEDLKEEYIKDMISDIPLKRFGESEDVAKVAAFLASKKASYITGQIVRVDGGLGM